MKSSLGRFLLAFSFILSGGIPITGRASSPFTAHSSEASVFSSPLPGSKYNPPGTTILLRFAEEVDAGTLGSASFEVCGSVSGNHNGKPSLSNDRRSLSFTPDGPFAPGETVTFTLHGGLASTLGVLFPPVAYSFSIAAYLSAAQAQAALDAVDRSDLEPAQAKVGAQSASTPAAAKYVTAPADFPVINVPVPGTQTAPGYIFASNWISPVAGSYLLMLDNNGEPVYYQRLLKGTYALDFKKLPDGTLAYWSSLTSSYSIMDSSYQVINTISVLGGYKGIDEHELQRLPNGNYIYMIYYPFLLDMSQIVAGGKNPATVVGLVIQEQDSSRNLVFEWHSWEHIPITDSNQDLTGAGIDYVHGNAIELDNTDGNLLLSARNLSEVLKIDHQLANPANLGNTIWTMGGKANQFTFSIDPGVNETIAQFYYQHDIRRLGAGGNITLFDNHDGHDAQASRALEYQINEINRTAKLVWEYRNSPDVFTPFMGDVQRVDNGNTVIGWGGNLSVAVTEVKPDGTKVFEMDFNGAFWNYRAFRFDWQGHPTQPPALAVQAGAGTVKLSFSWNGATDIKEYQVFGGSTPAAANLIQVQPRAGFETSLTLTDPQQAGYCYFRVMPVDNNSQTTTYTNLAFNPNCGIKNYIPLITN